MLLKSFYFCPKHNVVLGREKELSVITGWEAESTLLWLFSPDHSSSPGAAAKLLRGSLGATTAKKGVEKAFSYSQALGASLCSIRNVECEDPHKGDLINSVEWSFLCLWVPCICSHGILKYFCPPLCWNLHWIFRSSAWCRANFLHFWGLGELTDFSMYKDFSVLIILLILNFIGAKSKMLLC